LWSEGVKTSKIYTKILAVKKNVYEWVDRFERGRNTPDDEE
jgi:hypothetical protein